MRGFQMYVQSSSKPIRTITHVRLFLAAMVMQARKQQRLDLKQDDCEGRVTTAFESANIGGIAGTLFAAELDAEEGSTQVTFIVREIDLDEAITLFISGVPMADLFPYLGEEEKDAVEDDRMRWN
ncbi:hypothetical protein HY635_00795 [Candidatus Uhrbacteria bacterium]|nr:hypothetical protein [Candidatus Uhrbacteria bacterium]